MDGKIKNLFRIATCLLMVLMLTFTTIACTSGASGTNGTTGASGGTTVATTGNDEPKQSLVIGTYNSGNCCLDPHHTTSYGDYETMNQVYDTLVTADFDGSTICDSLAKTWEMSEDGLTYTFHLKDNVKFHSGKKMTSADVKWTYDRWRDPKEAALTRSFVEFVDSIETPDAATVVIKMTKPDNNFLINLTVPVAGILNNEAVEKAIADGKVYGTEVADGTGPFKFVEYVQNDCIKLSCNEEYAWGPSCYENKGAPHIGDVTIRFLPEPGTRLMEFQAGNVDILGNGCVFASELEKLKTTSFTEILSFSPPYPVFIQFQLKHVTDLAVRRACNMAIDRAEIVSTVMGNMADPMVGALPSNYKWYWKGADNYYPHDLQAAGKLLEDNGYQLKDDGYRYKDGKKLTIDIMFCAADEDAMTANLFQAQMKKIGVDVTVNTAMVSNFWSHINTNEFDTLIMGLYINTPEDMLYEYMSSKNLPYPNRQGFSDSEIDDLLAKARVTTDENKRKEYYDRIQEVAMEKAMWIPLYNRNGFLTVNNRVKNLKPHPTIVEGMPKLLDVTK